MKIPSNIITLIAGVAITLISLWYGQNHGLMPIAATEEAKQVDGIFDFMMTIATGLFLLIEGVLLIVVFKYRKPKGDDTDGPPIEGNVGLEIFWTAIPTVIVFILSIYSFEVYNNMGGLDPMVSHDHGTKMAHHQPASSSDMIALNTDSKIALGLGSSPDDKSTEPPLVINVNGIQYAWIFTYPESGITTGEIHVPVNKKVELNIVAGDVIHAFWIPEFRVKQDAVPGREAQLVITPTRLGNYPIICAELCGSYHGGMKTRFVVETQENYEKWVQENTFAQTDDLNKAVAINPANLSDGEFLQPYANEMGIETNTIKHIMNH